MITAVIPRLSSFLCLSNLFVSGYDSVISIQLFLFLFYPYNYIDGMWGDLNVASGEFLIVARYVLLTPVWPVLPLHNHVRSGDLITFYS